MTSRTENPKHMALHVPNESPGTIALIFWSMSDFNDAVFSAGFTGCGDILISSLKSSNNRISFVAFPERGLQSIGISSSPYTSKFSCCFPGAIITTISLIGRWWNYVKMLTATETISAIFSAVILLSAPPSSFSRSTSHRTITPIWTTRLELSLARYTYEVIHN